MCEVEICMRKYLCENTKTIKTQPLCLSKAELAMLYFPDSEPKVAVNHLMRWIYKCKPLMDDLNKTCYNKQAKFLLAQQVRKVVEYLGEP